MILFLYLKWEKNGKYNIIFIIMRYYYDIIMRLYKIFISTRLAFTCINCAILRMMLLF